MSRRVQKSLCIAGSTRFSCALFREACVRLNVVFIQPKQNETKHFKAVTFFLLLTYYTPLLDVIVYHFIQNVCHIQTCMPRRALYKNLPVVKY